MKYDVAGENHRWKERTMLSLKRMMGISAQVVVDAPRDKVFSYVTDFDRHHEWVSWEAETEKTSQGPVGVGSTFKRVGYELLGSFGSFGSYPVDVVVTEYAPNERLAFEHRMRGGFYHVYCIQLEPEPASGGTRATVRREQGRSPWWGWPLIVLLLPVWLPYVPFHRRKIRRIGSRLKEYYQRPAL